MRKSTVFRSGLATAAALASALGLVGSASAATTWTVSGFPPPPAGISGTSTDPVLTDSNTGTEIACPSSSVTVTGTDGTGLSGTGIAQVTAASWSGCSGPLGITFVLTAQNLPWSVNVGGYSATTGVTTGTVTGVEGHISFAGCTADIRGTTATSPGTWSFTHNDPTHIKAAPGGDLHFFNVSGCAGLINSGDPATYTADYVLSTPITITSP